MSLISLSRFQEITGLSDASLIWLLRNNRLPCEVSTEGGILVDAGKSEVKELVRSVVERQNTLLKEHELLLSERLGRIISDNLEEMMEEALALASGNSK